MQLPEGQVILAVAAGLLVTWFLISSGLVRLLALFCVTAALAYGVEWLVFLGIRVVAPHVAATGLSQGLVAWAFLPALVVAGFVTFTAWRDGV